MFKELGQLASLMKNLPKLQEDMDKLRHQVTQIVVDGDAGGGMVKVKVNGFMELVACSIQEDALKDRELLEDLIIAATNQAIKKAKEQVAEQGSNFASGLGMPANLGLLG